MVYRSVKSFEVNRYKYMKHNKNNSDITYVPVNNIWLARKKHGFTQKQLAFVLGHSSTFQIGHWEKGNLPDLKNALKLAVALSASVEYLFQDYIALFKSRIVPRKYEIEQADIEM